jgi:glycine hydroxymethyltransferase
MSSNTFFAASLAQSDPEIARAIDLELGRQRDEIELIASENIVSRAVLEAQGSVMTNKYAEGYPGRRYYGGCQFVDIAEKLAIDRVTELFGCKFANVQPNSGSQANQAVFLACLKPGDVFMGLDLAAGGHLTHGSSVNLSGKWFKPVSYGVSPDTQRIDMDVVEALAHEHKPKLIIAGGSAYARKMAVKSVFVAALILFFFAFGGSWLLGALGISLDADEDGVLNANDNCPYVFNPTGDAAACACTPPEAIAPDGGAAAQ